MCHAASPRRVIASRCEHVLCAEPAPTAVTGVGRWPRISSAIARSCGARTHTAVDVVVLRAPADAPRRETLHRAEPLRRARSRPARERRSGSATCPSRRAGRAPRSREAVGLARRRRRVASRTNTGTPCASAASHDFGVRARRRCHDDSVAAGSARRRRRRRSLAPPSLRPLDARLGACDDRHLAAECAQVAQDVHAPATASNEPDDHRATLDDRFSEPGGGLSEGPLQVVVVTYSRPSARAMMWKISVWSIRPRAFAACGPSAAIRTVWPVCVCEEPVLVA